MDTTGTFGALFGLDYMRWLAFGLALIGLILAVFRIPWFWALRMSACLAQLASELWYGSFGFYTTTMVIILLTFCVDCYGLYYWLKTNPKKQQKGKDKAPTPVDLLDLDAPTDDEEGENAIVGRHSVLSPHPLSYLGMFLFVVIGFLGLMYAVERQIYIDFENNSWYLDIYYLLAPTLLVAEFALARRWTVGWLILVFGYGFSLAADWIVALYPLQAIHVMDAAYALVAFIGFGVWFVSRQNSKKYQAITS